MGQRMFVAVVPTDPVREHLADFLKPRTGLRWSPPDQWHVTLAFLAAVPEHAVDELVERLGATAARRAPFTARLSGAGAFPHAGRASVLWLGVDQIDPAGVQPTPGEADAPRPTRGQTPLHRLALGARAAANAAGAAPDGRAFLPHLTLARLRRPIEATSWLRVLDTYTGPPWRVDRIDLVASHLGQGPGRHPRYETVATLRLGGPGHD